MTVWSCEDAARKSNGFPASIPRSDSVDWYQLTHQHFEALSTGFGQVGDPAQIPLAGLGGELLDHDEPTVELGTLSSMQIHLEMLGHAALTVDSMAWALAELPGTGGRRADLRHRPTRRGQL